MSRPMSSMTASRELYRLCGWCGIVCTPGCGWGDCVAIAAAAAVAAAAAAVAPGGGAERVVDMEGVVDAEGGWDWPGMVR